MVSTERNGKDDQDGRRPGRRPGVVDAKRELAGMRGASKEYAALVRNMTWTFQMKGLAVQVEGTSREEMEPIGGEVPSFIARSEKALFILEFATAEMLRNVYLLERLRALQRAETARRWLVVPSDLWAEARAFVSDLRLEWQVIVGDR